MSDISIEEFYNNNKCNIFFDEQYYLEQHPETEPFYKKHCKVNNIDNKSRLYLKSTEQDPHICADNNKKQYYIDILKYVIDNIPIKDRLQKDSFDD